MSASTCIRNGCLYKRREGMEYCCVRCSNNKSHGPLCISIKTLTANPTTYYTIKGKLDGFGEQYLAVMSGIAYCNKKNYMYIHSPFTKMHHGCNVEKANQFIGLLNVAKQGQSRMIVQSFAKEVHFCRTPSLYYNAKALGIIRGNYYRTEKPFIDNIDIAIHIRRGDIEKNKNVRYTDNLFYKNLIHALKLKYPEYSIVIFSEGKYEDFKNLDMDESCFRLNTNVFATFHSLVCAKVLIQAKSSFSYCAGLLNENTVYHMNGYLHKLDHWLDAQSLNKAK